MGLQALVPTRVPAFLPLLCPNTQERANAFIAEVKRTPDVWRLCLERFSVSAFPEVKFWCLQTLHEVRGDARRAPLAPLQEDGSVA